MANRTGVAETKQLTTLQWQLMMKCWKMNLRPGQVSWWAPTAWRLGAVGLWLYKLRKLNGPNFTWSLLMFSSAIPQGLASRMGKLYKPKPVTIKSRKELLATIKPHHWQYLRADNGDMPEGYVPAASAAAAGTFRVL